MNIRDEAHRRAITYHRQLRGKRLKASDLDRIPGVGPKRKRALLKHFGSVADVTNTPQEELLKVPGINQALAEAIASFFSNNRE
jgi:excinuclease ABC subunit C